ncbi:hypothetical protein BDV38DRAFT_251238 [Aspergillus pseudotamarii]|uniref:Uncharacterized protein n=1 Tax=Aspergillus pseudotamarii TaxID=132259 RepID=A0A5N6SPK3_ASPPS|nr:uncharacterized protein BDV38DRAFT_251238 [Aspergillus pseudotamarii]KAE8135700.1 hypothetical protein BDV38DRAFT_251238 [Aspergillus pseudotamarii]
MQQSLSNESDLLISGGGTKGDNQTPSPSDSGGSKRVAGGEQRFVKVRRQADKTGNEGGEGWKGPEPHSEGAQASRANGGGRPMWPEKLRVSRRGTDKSYAGRRRTSATKAG